MKAQSALMPLKAEMEFISEDGKPYLKPRVVKTNGHVNKGRDKDWYKARMIKLAKKYGLEENDVEISWT